MCPLHVGRAGPNGLAYEAVGDEENNERDEEVCKREVENVMRGADPEWELSFTFFKHFARVASQFC